MKSHKSTRFEKQLVELDANEYHDCNFIECMMIYAGITRVVVTGCKFVDCQWQFDGAAGNTLDFLKAMDSDIRAFTKRTSVESKVLIQ